MNGSHMDDAVRNRMHAALDPLVPGPDAHARVARSLREQTARTPRWPLFAPFRRGAAAFAVAAAVVILLGGALTISLALRSRTTPPPAPAGHPVAPPTATATLSPPTPSATPAPPTAAPATATPMPSLAACDGNMLSAVFGDQRGAAGTEGGDIALRNTSATPCTMDGYANLEGYSGGSLTQLGVTHSVGGTLLNNNNGTLPRQQRVVLQPGQTAYVAVEYSVVPDQSNSGQCPTYTALAVTPPNGTHFALAQGSFMLCGGHGAQIWIDEAPVSTIAYYKVTP